MLPLVRSRSRSGSRSNSSSPEIVSIRSESRSPWRPPPARPRNSGASGSGGPTAGGAGASGSGGPAAGGGGPAAGSGGPTPGQDPATALLPTIEEWPVTHPFRVCWPLYRGEESYVLPPHPGRRTPERRRRAGRLERRRAEVPLSLQGWRWPLCWQSSYCWDPAQCAKAVSSASSGKAIRSEPVGLPRLHHMVASAARHVCVHKRTDENGSSAGVAAGCILRGHH